MRRHIGKWESVVKEQQREIYYAMPLRADILRAARSGLRFTPAGIAALLGIADATEAIAACTALEKEGCLDMVNGYYGSAAAVNELQDHWQLLAQRQETILLRQVNK